MATQVEDISAVPGGFGIWARLRREAEAATLEEPLFAGIRQATGLDQDDVAAAFSFRLAQRLLKDRDTEEVAKFLKKQGMATRCGPPCAQPALLRFGLLQDPRGRGRTGACPARLPKA